MSTQEIAHYRGRDWFEARALPIHVGAARIERDYKRHDHDWMEIVLVVHGSGTHVSLQGAQAIGAGDVFVLRPGVWHGYENCCDLDVVTVSFGLEILSRELAWLQRDMAISHLLWTGPLASERGGLMALRLDVTAARECETHLLAMRDAGRDDAELGHLAQLGHLLLLLRRVAAALEPEHWGVSEKSLLHDAVRECVLLLEEAPAHPWTLDELARRVHLDRSYLSRLFKSALGLPPLAYLARLRLERAAALLVRGECTIGEIGAMVGWSDASYFAARFKAHFGMTAKEYRAEFARRVHQ